MISHLLWVTILCLAGCGQSARILAVLPFASKSHFIFMSPILKALNNRGHQIVEYSPFPIKKPITNYTHVEIHTSLEDKERKWTYEQFVTIAESDQPRIGLGFTTLWWMIYEYCEDTLKHKNIQKLLNSDEHFDLVITESAFGQESMVVFGHKFQAPTVTLHTGPMWSTINRIAGNTLSITSIPDYISIVATDQMSFLKRLSNFISIFITLFIYYNYHLPVHEKIIKDNYRQDIPPLVEMVSNISLYLVNGHSTIEYPRPYSPNIIPLGGISLSPERTPLPQNIKSFMDEAKNGVIYFSFGTVVPAHTFPETIIQIFVNVFKKFSQKVLWKIELENIPNLSENVMLTKWVSQPGVLAHPNCVLFLTHGGLLGQLEAIRAGVPTVGVPFYGDQPYNVKFSEHRGFGVELDYKTLSEDTLISALNRILNNPKYKEHAQRMSHIFQDQPLSPIESAVFWVEYVLRHNGAHHLRPAAAQLSWYQLFLLDVLLTVTAIAIVVLGTLYLVIRKLFKMLSNIHQNYIKTNKQKIKNT